MKLILALIIALVSIPAMAAVDNGNVDKVEAYLNSLTTMSADFTQVDAEGNVSGGKFMLKRPGKFRWVYDARTPIEIVADGKQLVYYDKKLKEVTYTSLQDSLAGFLARKNIKLSGDVKLISAEEKSNMIRVKLTQREKPEEGKLSMYFAGTDMKLSMLEIEDQNGGVTKVVFNNQKFGQEIADKAFIFHDPKYAGNVWDKN